MITHVPKYVELKYRPEIGWYINVNEGYPEEIIKEWAVKIAYPMMKKRISDLPKGDLREHMKKVLPDLLAGKVTQRIFGKGDLNLFKSTEKQTKTKYYYG